VTILPASQTGAEGSVKTYALTAKNNDSSNAICANPNRTFTLALTGLPACVPVGWFDDLEPDTGSLAPQATYAKNVEIASCVGAYAVPSSFTLTITATEGASSENDSADYNINALSAEICNTPGDDDLDGKTNCLDPDCLGDPACCGDGTKETYETCDDNGDCGFLEQCVSCGSCVSTVSDSECPINYDDCDCNSATGASGCESNLLTSKDNCGVCGNLCPWGCENGACLEPTGGLVPCGRIADNFDTIWNEVESCNFCHVIRLANNVINYLVSIVGLIAVLSIAIGGFMSVTSLGGPGGLATVKLAISKSVTGFIFVLVAWVIANLFMVVFGFIDPMGDGSWRKINCNLITTSIGYYCGDGMIHTPNSDGINEICDPKELKSDFIARKTSTPGNCVNADAICPIGCFTAIDSDCINKSDAAAWVETIYSCNPSLCDYGCVGDIVYPGFSDIGGGCYNPLGTAICQKGRFVCDFDAGTVNCENTYNDEKYRLAGNYCEDIFDECCRDGGVNLPSMTFDIVRLPTTNITSCTDWDCYWPGYQDGVCTCPAGYKCDDICKNKGGKVCIGVGLMDVGAHHCISLKDNGGNSGCSGDYGCNNNTNLQANDCRANFYTTGWTCDECADLVAPAGNEPYDFSVAETACYCQ